ncbi:RpiR family carbohydrate utilization transcriptional regulator [Neisseria sp. HSC-16F19]|nr:MurR/RpiR family transcriptional regulator [Neisseria sp. HSC-16F19]MCP2040268.1 RpiR family carbohydrate utilization transcriptional regulator [Neisseria sp. HSC-16F19]
MLATISQKLPDLSKAERKVGECVLADAKWFVHAAVADIAREADVSQPTVIRFCRSLGYKGLPEFKISLSASLGNGGTPFVHAELDSGDSMHEVVEKVLGKTAAAVLASRAALSETALEQAVALLAQARRVEFYGVGNSGIVAQDAQHKFFRFGGSTVAYTDNHVQLMAASVLGPQDVVVAISHSGSSADLMDAVALAKDNGAAVIAITRAASPLAAAADVLINVQSHEDGNTYAPMVSRLLQLMVVDMLAIGLALHLGENVSDILAKTKDSIRKKRRPDPEDGRV